MGCFKSVVIYWKLGNVGYDAAVKFGGARNFISLVFASQTHAISCAFDRAYVANYLHFCRCDLGGDRLVDKFPYFTNVPNNSLKLLTGYLYVLPEIGENWIGHKSYLIPDV